MTAPVVTRIGTDAPGGGDMVPTPTPALSWMTHSATPDWIQARAEIELRAEGAVRIHTIDGRASVRVPWPFPPLAERDRVQIRVRVTGQDGESSGWSDPRPLTAGFLAKGEWVAHTIAVADPTRYAQPAVLRREFRITSPVRRATLYATAAGAYQVELNGADIDDQVLKPGWTPFDRRRVHDTTDVTGSLVVGENAIAVRLAGGWATERYGFGDGARPVYAEQPAFAAQLLIEYADGSSELLITDEQWKSASGPLISSGLYSGENYDARRVLIDSRSRTPSHAGHDSAGWTPVVVRDPGPVPQARVAPPVRRIHVHSLCAA